jgi:hypothetical protein
MEHPQKQQREVPLLIFTGILLFILAFLVLMLSVVAVAGSWTWAFYIPAMVRVVMFAAGVFGFVVAIFGFTSGNYAIRRTCFPIVFTGPLVTIAWALLLMYLMYIWMLPVVQLVGFLLAFLILGLSIICAVLISAEDKKFQ